MFLMKKTIHVCKHYIGLFLYKHLLYACITSAYSSTNICYTHALHRPIPLQTSAIRMHYIGLFLYKHLLYSCITSAYSSTNICYTHALHRPIPLQTSAIRMHYIGLFLYKHLLYSCPSWLSKKLLMFFLHSGHNEGYLRHLYLFYIFWNFSLTSAYSLWIWGEAVESVVGKGLRGTPVLHLSGTVLQLHNLSNILLNIQMMNFDKK